MEPAATESIPSTISPLAESFKAESHLTAIVTEAQLIVSSAVGRSRDSPLCDMQIPDVFSLRTSASEIRPMKILVLNSGSSSQKACLYEIGDALPENPPVPLWKGRIEWA